MATPHKHAELIKAWADGAEIQVRGYLNGEHTWHNIESPTWGTHQEYRLKPEPKPDVVSEWFVEAHQVKYFSVIDRQKNIRLTFDGETGKLKSAEVIS